MKSSVHKRIAVNDCYGFRHDYSFDCSIKEYTPAGPVPLLTSWLRAQSVHNCVVAKCRAPGAKHTPDARHYNRYNILAANMRSGREQSKLSSLGLRAHTAFITASIAVSTAASTATLTNSTSSPHRVPFPDAGRARGPASRARDEHARQRYGSRHSNRSPTHGAAAHRANTCARGA